MTELRTLHVTDLHDEYEKYQVIASYVAGKKSSNQAIDAVFITGDFIEGDFNIKDKTAYKIVEGIKSLSENGTAKAEEGELKALMEKHQKDGKLDVDALDENTKKQFEALDKKISDKVADTIKKIVIDSYQKHAEELSKIGTPILGIMGNHDLNIGYEILKDKVACQPRVPTTGGRSRVLNTSGMLALLGALAFR